MERQEAAGPEPGSDPAGQCKNPTFWVMAIGVNMQGPIVGGAPKEFADEFERPAPAFIRIEYPAAKACLRKDGVRTMHMD